MFNLKCVFLVFFCFISFVFSANLEDYDVHVDLGQDWKLVDASGRSFFYQLDDYVGTLNVRVVYFPQEEIVTANGFQRMRMTHYFDGWVHRFERPGTVYETLAANVEDMYLAVYSKHDLDARLQVNEQFVIEYYFIDDKKGYLISYHVPKLLWPSVESYFRSFLDGFWVGQGERQIMDYVLEEQDWAMKGHDSLNRYFLDVDLPIQSGLTQNWQVKMPFIDSFGPPTILFNDQDLMIAYADQLSLVDHQKGTLRWQYDFQGLISDRLAYAHDIIFCVVGEKIKKLTAILRQGGSVLYTVKLKGDVSPLIYSHQKLIFFQDQLLTVLHYDTGDVLWTWPLKQGSFIGHPIVDNQFLSVVDTEGVLRVFHSQSGVLLWETSLPGEVLFTPIVSQGMLVVGMKRFEQVDQPMISFFAYDFKTGKRRWVYQDPKFVYDIQGVPIADDERFYFSKRVTESEEVFYFLHALDLKTGELLWKQSYLPRGNRPFQQKLTRSFVFVEDFEKNVFLGMDVLTGDKVPIYFNYDAMTEPYQFLDLFVQDLSLYVLYHVDQKGFVLSCYR